MVYQMSFDNNQWQIDEVQDKKINKEVNTSLFWFNKNNRSSINISFIIYHYRSMSEDDLMQTLSTLCKQEYMPEGTQIEYIILLDGISLDELPLIKNIVCKRQDTTVVETNKKFTGAGLMWNAGLNIASGEKICVTWTGVYWLKDSLFHLNRILTQEDVDAAYGQVRYEINDKVHSFEMIQPGQYEANSAWVQSLNCIPLCYTLFERDLILKLQGFYTDTALCRIADWEFMLRACSIASLKQLKGTPIPAKMSLCNLYKSLKFNESLDELIRFSLRDTLDHANKKSTSSMLSEEISTKIKQVRNKKNKPIKIGIVSDLKESTQVQLCLLNYFSYLKKQVTWRWFHEPSIKPTELKGYDIIFFVRSRTNQGVKAAQYCFKKDIKTVYIIDDNWFWATETYPQLEDQIGVHTNAYQNFLLFISTVDYILVYNDLLEQDMRRFNNSVIKFPANVDLRHFNTKPTKDDNHIIRIGFAGSNSKLPFFDPVFKALHRIMKRYEKVHLYFKGLNLPETFDLYTSRIQSTPYIFDYHKYAKELAQANCHIMISPLSNTRYINSKCPNKYLEITAAGATGIYSRNKLYEGIITNGYNGLIVENEEEQWFNAFEQLINNPTFRKEMYMHALSEIQKQYNTKELVSRFNELLNQIVYRY